MADKFRVTVTADRGRPVRVPGLAAWLQRVAPARARGTVNIALVSDARMRSLNRAFRGKDRVTDVLSFPSHPDTSPQSPALSLQWCLGDIAIGRQAARRQAAAAGHDEATELRVLALHGLLHLIGYDHERDNGRMRRVEQRLRRKGGLREGLIERAHS
jgi:probable rRNA maturation factor